MNENKIFVIVKGEDKTKDIEKVEYDCINGKYYIKYLQNYKSYVYKITDESSQVDLLAGCLAISKAKNVIIVGDTKQLPQIVNKEIKNKIQDENIDICYNYFENNILSAMLRIYENKVPRKILREHYRCHPKIIEFCNKR